MKKLPEKFRQDRKTVCIQGMGFVGSAMALAVASAEDGNGQPLYNVIGVDIPDEAGYKKAAAINGGIFPYENNDKKLGQALKKAYTNGNLWAVTEPGYFQYADVVVVDINLDVKYTEDDQPRLDLELFQNAVHTLGRYIKPETLVMVETTVPPGTCENVVYPVLMEEFQKRGICKTDILIAHSYERVMPGDQYFDSIVNFWRVYSGINEKAADRCQEFLESIIDTEKYPLIRLEKPAATETAKILENSYRAVTIAFMEEWGRFAEAVGIDLFEVIHAIRMRPTHSNMRQPGFGVGGYCLTKDPYFAPLSAKEIFGMKNMEFPFSTLAVQVNRKMPLVSLNKIQALLDNDLHGKRILLLGISYRQDVGDTRYSPSEIFVKEACRRGAEMICQDPMVDYWPEMNLRVLHEIPPFTEFDAVIFTVPHKQYQELDFKKLDFQKKDTGQKLVIFDANCVLQKEQRMDLQNSGQIMYASIGRGNGGTI